MSHAYAKQELEERYKKLPSVLKDAMFSPEVAEKMFEIGKKNGLTIEKIGFVAEETGFIILGLTQPREFVKILSDRLGTDRDAASKIASDINHAILFPLRETLKSAHDIEVGEAELHAPPAEIVRPSGAKPLASASPVSVPPLPISAPQKTTPPAEMRPPAQPPAPLAEKKPETRKAPIIPGFISPGEVEKIVTAEKEKKQMSPIAAIDLRGQKLPDANHVLPMRQWGTSALPQHQATSAAGPLIIPKPPPITPQLLPKREPEIKNEIDLRPLAPAQTPPAMPPPIIIPPNPQAPSDPLKDIPQNPKIPPIDLRATPKPASAAPPAGGPPVPKKYDGYDPYREPVE